MFIKCEKCGHVHVKRKFEKNLNICQKCHFYGKMRARERIKMVMDKDSFQELLVDFEFSNPINFPEYKEKYINARKKSELSEAIIIGTGDIKGIPVVIGVMDSYFMMGSMGAVVGEKIAYAFELAADKKLPIIIFCASGGARMQEGILSLMQMAKTSAAVAKFSERGGLYISILTNPTMGGVSASFAFLGDVILAEPQALIGFAGKRVIQNTINQVLPENFQTAEFLLEHGFIDSLVEREKVKDILYQLLRYHKYNNLLKGRKE